MRIYRGAGLANPKLSMLKPRLFFILFCPIVVFLMAIDAPASSLCGDFYEDRSDRHAALDFFKQFRNDSLPFGFQRLSRKKDYFDIFLLEQSYAVGGIHRPVEMGLIELLDFKGNVLDYQQVIGNYPTYALDAGKTSDLIYSNGVS